MDINEEKVPPPKTKRQREYSSTSSATDSEPMAEILILKENQKELSDKVDNLVTKCDLKDFFKDLGDKILCEIKNDLKFEIDGIKQELKEELENVKSDNKRLAVENKELKTKVDNLTSELYLCLQSSNESARRSNRNEQYSRKTSLKIFGVKEEPNEKLETKILEIAKLCSKSQLQLEISDITAVHRIPSQMKSKPKPILLKLKNSDVKYRLMKFKREFFNHNMQIYNDITRLNSDLIKHLKTNDYIKSAWYYNCDVYAKMEGRKPVKIDLFEDFEQKIKSAPIEMSISNSV